MMQRILAASSASSRMAAGALALALGLAACNGGTDTTGAAGGNRELLRFSSAGVPPAYKDEAFSYTLTPVGGVSPYQYRMSDGALPPGVTMNGNVLSGTPTQPGSYSFTVRVSDAQLASTTQTFSIAVQEQPIPTVSLELPLTELRGETRVPIRIQGARKVAAVRFQWRVPDGVTVAGVASSGVKSLMLSQVKNGKLTLDMGFVAPPNSGDVLAFLNLKVQKPVRIPPGNTGFEVRTLEGRTLNKIALNPPPTSVPAATPATAPAGTPTTPGGAPTGTPPTATPPAPTAPGGSTPPPANPAPTPPVSPPPTGQVDDPSSVASADGADADSTDADPDASSGADGGQK